MRSPGDPAVERPWPSPAPSVFPPPPDQSTAAVPHTALSGEDAAHTLMICAVGREGGREGGIKLCLRSILLHTT